MTALVIDEAQSLPPALLEEVRLLANIENEAVKLLPLVLVGQPELAARLDEPEWDALKQRVGLRCQVGPLDIRDTAAYIAGRVRIAGGDVRQVITRDAVGVIFDHSRGVPRTISVICDNALVSGFASGVKPITRDIVLEVCREFRLGDVEDEAVREAAAAESRASDGRAVALVSETDAEIQLRPGARIQPIARSPESRRDQTPMRPPAAARVFGPSRVSAGGPDGRERPAVRPVRPPAQSSQPIEDQRPLFSHFHKKRRFLFF